MQQDEEHRPFVVFFLGAGASVPAGVPDTFGFVKSFVADLQKKPVWERDGALEIVTEILKTLEAWKKRKNDKDTRIDIELLLETLEKLQNKEDEPLIEFYKDGKYLLETFSEKKPVIDLLKDFVKKRAIVKESKIHYLEPFRGFIQEFKSIDIFSTNYDITIEQFCNVYRKRYVDGFDIHWNPDAFKNENVDVRLYKIHGSVMWYRTDRGSYIKIPIMSEENKIDLITGETARTLMVYPVQKWDYAEPLLELLITLKKTLEKTKWLFVVGYSFRDDHIRRIFWDVAGKNPELTVFLISRRSPQKYKDRLTYYEENIPSSLQGRVICLPYRFEKIFLALHNYFFENAISGANHEYSEKIKEAEGKVCDWGQAIKYYLECEHVDKITDLIDKSDENKFHWVLSFEIYAKMAILYSIRGEKATAQKWREKYLEVLETVIINKLYFEISRKPDCLEILFNYKGNKGGGSYDRIDSVLNIFQNVLQFRDKRLSWLSDDRTTKTKLKKITKPLSNLIDYLKIWGDKGVIKIEHYSDIRKDESLSELKRIEELFRELDVEYNEEKVSDIKRITLKIEQPKIMKIVQNYK